MNATQCWHLTCIEQQPEGVLRWKGGGGWNGGHVMLTVIVSLLLVSTDSQSVSHSVSQSGSPITYIHTRTHALARTECHIVYVCALNSLWRRHRQQRQTTTIDTTTTRAATTNERPQLSASVAAAAALSVVIGAVATLFINCQAHIA